MKVYSRGTDERGHEVIVMPASQVMALLDMLDSLPEYTSCVVCGTVIKFKHAHHVEPDGVVCCGVHCQKCYDERYKNA